MRTLYIRVFLTTVFIMIASGLIAFLASNAYYHYFLKEENDTKLTETSKEIVGMLEESHGSGAREYLHLLTKIGYQFYLVDADGNGETFGRELKSYNYPPEQLAIVLEGGIYHGIADYPRRLFVTGFFNSELRNSIGVRVEIDGEQKALFIRPDTVQQFGEMRYFIAILATFAFVFSLVLITLSTRFLVQPIRELSEATQKIVGGNYHIKLNVNRSDEIGRLAKDFTKMSDDIQQTEEKRQQFVSNVSHEIQSPLTSIQGFSQALRDDDMPAEIRNRYLSIIEKESKRLSLLSKQLLTLSFLDSEMDEREKISFDLYSQLKDIIATMEWQSLEKDLTINLPNKRINIIGDPKLLYQVWVNLFTNAVYYTNEGGTIEIQMNQKENETEVIFIDDGVGIAPEHQAQLFDRFYIIDKARTRTNASTGLGLSIVKKIIELHGGTIMIESELGKGSTFIVTIPHL